MSVFACRELADDFMRSPLAPVVTMGGMTSVNHDNYADTDVGLEQIAGLAAGEYPNVPPIAFFNTVRTVDNAADFSTAYAASAAGDAIVIPDGQHDWGGISYCSRSFTIDDPLYILAETRHGVSFTSASSFSLSIHGLGHVVAGLVIDDTVTTRDATLEAYFDPGSYIRFSCIRFDSTIKAPVLVRNTTDELIGFEVDNCSFDSLDDPSVGNAHIFISTVNPALPATVSNPRYVRLHHNTHANISNAGPEVSPIVIGLGWQCIDPADTNNPYNNTIKTIVENCTIDSCNGDDEQVEIKSGSTIFRHNLIIDGGPEAGFNLRLSDNSLTYGNWIENAGEQGARVSGRDAAIVFNYIGSSGATPALVMHGYVIGVDPLLWNYIPCDRAQFRYNVLTRYTLVAQNLADGTRFRNMTDVNIADNAFYSSTMPQTDVAGNGNYLDSAGGYNETQFRSENSWGVNSYNAADLAITKTKDAALFVGPGSVYTPSDPTVLFGQPSELHAPSWWA